MFQKNHLYKKTLYKNSTNFSKHGKHDKHDSKIFLENEGNYQKNPKNEIKFETFPKQTSKVYNFISLEKGKFKINKEAMDYLSSISKPIIVVSIVGPYRSAKSFLMNHIMQRSMTNPKHCFKVQYGLDSITKGIWFCVNEYKDFAIIGMDSEGLGSFERSDNEDAKLFSMILSMSSILLYNIKNVISTDTLEDLAFATKVGKFLKGKSSFMPHLCWVIRDALSRGSGDEYLQRCSRTYKQDKIWNSINNFFKSKNCLFFPFPSNQNLLYKIHNVRFNFLDEGFRNQVEKIQKMIRDEKFFFRNDENKIINGQQFGKFIQIIVENINKRIPIELVSVWDGLKIKQLEELWKSASFSLMKEPFTIWKRESLQLYLNSKKEELINKFREETNAISLNYADYYVREYSMILEDEANRILKINDQKIDEHINNVWNDLREYVIRYNDINSFKNTSTLTTYLTNKLKDYVSEDHIKRIWKAFKSLIFDPQHQRVQEKEFERQEKIREQERLKKEAELRKKMEEERLARQRLEEQQRRKRLEQQRIEEERRRYQQQLEEQQRRQRQIEEEERRRELSSGIYAYPYLGDYYPYLGDYYPYLGDYYPSPFIGPRIVILPRRFSPWNPYGGFFL